MRDPIFLWVAVERVWANSLLFHMKDYLNERQKYGLFNESWMGWVGHHGLGKMRMPFGGLITN